MKIPGFDVTEEILIKEELYFPSSNTYLNKLCLLFFVSGIALKKVEQKENEKQEEANGGVSSQTDVASILARRVAVEMSDSDNENASDSEYDSDDWGDESNAWPRSKLLSSLKQQKEYFFKSQESLATVIDNDEEEEITSEETTPIETTAAEPASPGASASATATPSATTSATTPATTPATTLATTPVAASAPDLAPETEEAENKATTQTEKQLNDEDEMATASKKTTNV